MLKIMGIVCICGFCIYMGFYMASLFRKKVFFLSEILRLIQHLEISLEFLRQTREQIKYELVVQFPKLKNIIKDGFEGRISKSTNLDEQDIQKLEQLFDLIGSCDLNGQLSAMEFYKHYFESRYEKLSAELEQKNKLCIGLGACAAAFIGVILI